MASPRGVEDITTFVLLSPDNFSLDRPCVVPRSLLRGGGVREEETGNGGAVEDKVEGAGDDGDRDSSLESVDDSESGGEV